MTGEGVVFMNKTIVDRFYSTTTALAKMTFQIDFSRPTPSLRGSNTQVQLHLEEYVPAECALERFLCWLKVKNLRQENYQVEGVYWLLQKELAARPRHGVRGGLLADEMGLGKTIQIVGAMMVNQLQRTLVVLPLALLEQWRSIIQNITGIPPLVFHGPARHKLSLADLKSQKIILTTYGHIALSEGDPVTPLHRIRFNRLVFDEAHHLRNSGTKKHIGAKALRREPWLLTGTPVKPHDGFPQQPKILGFSMCFQGEHTGACSPHQASVSSTSSRLRRCVAWCLGVSPRRRCCGRCTSCIPFQCQVSSGPPIHAHLNFAKTCSSLAENANLAFSPSHEEGSGSNP